MLQFTLVGNLGADAKLREANGKKFVSLSVAHTERLFDNKTQTYYDSTVWVGVTLNRYSDNLLKYLVRGTKVLVIGRGRLRTFFNQQHQAQAGLDIMADSLELLTVPESTRADAKTAVETNQPATLAGGCPEGTFDDDKPF